MAEAYEADIVIVGAGVAGTLIGYQLASAGARVVILESGPWVDRGEALLTYQLSLAKTPESPYPDLPYAPRPTVLDLDAYFVQDGPEQFKSTYERRVGGTTWHWQGTAMRNLPNDFRMRTLYGIGEDWPLTYAELEPWYSAAEQELGVAGASDLGSPRSGPYPLPPIPASYLDQQINAALQPHGLEAPVSPHARNSVPFQNRPVCCGNNVCVPLCPIGAKYDASVHATLAQQAGAQLIDQAVVYKLDVSAEGAVERVHFKRPDGSDHTATGRFFVVAAHAIESAKLLLMSRSAALPAGVANRSDQVGRNLMDHPTLVSLCLAGEPIYPYRGPVEISGIEQLRDGPFRSESAAFRVPIGNDGWSFGGRIPTQLAGDMLAEQVRGAELRNALQDMSVRQVRLAALIEQLPDPNNRVTLADETDALGLPRPKISYAYDEYVMRGRDEARKLADLVFDGLGATMRTHVEELFGAGHIIGTYRMGTDPNSSVADASGRSHDHANLYLAGSGLFPSTATANPTLTIAALALRTADALQRELGA